MRTLSLNRSFFFSCPGALVFLLLSSFPSSCGSSSSRLTREGLIKLVDHDKELAQTVVVNGIKVQLKYCPYQLLMMQEMDGDNGVDSARVRQLDKKYRSQYYFRLSFSKNNQEVIRQLGSFHRYSDMLQVFSFQMAEYINATSPGRDTVHLTDYAFEQEYGMSGANTCLLVFKKDDFAGRDKVALNIAEFGLGTGSLRFDIEPRKLESLPRLDLSAMR